MSLNKSFGPLWFVICLAVIGVMGLAAHAADQAAIPADQLISQYKNATSDVGRAEILDQLVKLGDTGIPAIAKAIDDNKKDVKLRTDFAITLGKTKSPQAVSVLMGLLPGRREGGLIKTEAEPNKEVFKATVTALVTIGEPAVPTLIPAINGKSMYASQGALTALAQINTPQCQQAILDAAKNTKKLSQQSKVAIITALSHMDSTEAVTQLAEQIKSVQSSSVKAGLMQGFFNTGSGTDTELRSAVINALGVNKTHPEIAVPALTKLLNAKGEDVIHRAIAARSIAQYNVPEVFPAMQTAFKLLPDLKKQIDYIISTNADRSASAKAKDYSSIAVAASVYESEFKAEYSRQVDIWVPMMVGLNMSVYRGLGKSGQEGIAFVESMQGEKKYKEFADDALKILKSAK